MYMAPLRHFFARLVWVPGLVYLISHSAAYGQILFTNTTTAAGITYSLPPAPPSLTEYAVAQTGGAAAADFDQDGWPDLFVSRHWDSPVLYRNNQDGTFSDVTAAAFPGGINALRSNGVVWGDVDNDGDEDLYVTSLALQNYLYINDGAGHFVEAATARGVQIGFPAVGGTSASFGDYDNDGYLDLYTGEWAALSNPTPIPSHARLFRNLGAANPGHFEDVTAASGTALGPLTPALNHAGKSFTPRFADFDRDGHVDLLVAGDVTTTRLFWNNGDGTFTDGTAAIFSNLGHSDMGLAIGDIDGNGLLDWFTTDIYASTDSTTGNRLFRNFGNRTFLESSSFSGVRDAGWGWGTEFLDFDNDRDLDLVATNGFYFTTAQQTDQVRLWANNGVGGVLTAFTNVANQTGLTDTSQGRGLLTFDYDRDGDLDIFIVNNYSTPVLYRNDGGNQGAWIEIDAIGIVSNADGVGAFITLTPDLAQPEKRIVREISGSSSYLSQSESIAHFGLGNAEVIDLITIEWPASGIVQELRNVAPNQFLSIIERHPCDFNGNGTVDVADYTVWRNALGAEVVNGTSADANGDAIVDAADYALWKSHFGETLGLKAGAGAASANVQTVAEPASFFLSALLGTILIPCWRRR